ncbi:MAG TPA: hypothetical protein VGD97_03650 [Lacunisphaera sp.]
MFTEARAAWLYENYLWLEANLPKRTDGSSAQLILPLPEFYPMRNTMDHAYAHSVFDATRGFMGLLEWPCMLIPQTDEERNFAAAAMAAGGIIGEMPTKDAAGTFKNGDQVEITYSPSLLREPVGLVSTLAHELCHYLLAAVKSEPPCGWPEHEPLTDLAAVHEGFGVFLANSAFNFSQWSDSQQSGWQWSKRGYLNEAELGFALGIFVVRSKIAPDIAGRLLKPNPAAVYWDSLDYIADLEQQRPQDGAWTSAKHIKF